MSARAVCLRFVSGPMLGRVVALQHGVNTIGSAGGCDVLLAASDAQARHVELVVGETATALRRVGDAPVALNGRPVEAALAGIVAGDRIAIGHAAFDVERLADAGLAAHDGDADADEPMLADPLPPAAVPAEPAPRPSVKQLVTRASPAFAAAFALSAVLLFWALGASFAGTRPSADGDLAQLRAAIAGFPEVELVSTGAGRVQVTGFVESQPRKDALALALAGFRGTAVDRVQVVDALVERARQYLGDPAIAVSYAGQGQLVVTGAARDAAAHGKVQRLADDLLPAVHVSDRLQVAPVAAAAASSAAPDAWANWQALLPARVVGITETEDGLRHIQLANGSRYYEGSILKSGEQLRLLKDDELVIAPKDAPKEALQDIPKDPP